MADATEFTKLDLLEVGLTPYSVRGLALSLEPIESATYQRRDLNYRLHNLAPSQAQLYRYVIAGDDVAPPAFDGLRSGDLVTVHAAEEWAYQTSSDTDGPSRNAVPGSTYTEDGFSYYRPIFKMMVTTWSRQYLEWEARHVWELILEEYEPPVVGSS